MFSTISGMYGQCRIELCERAKGHVCLFFCGDPLYLFVEMLADQCVLLFLKTQHLIETVQVNLGS